MKEGPGGPAFILTLDERPGTVQYSERIFQAGGFT